MLKISPQEAAAPLQFPCTLHLGLLPLESICLATFQPGQSAWGVWRDSEGVNDLVLAAFGCSPAGCSLAVSAEKDVKETIQYKKWTQLPVSATLLYILYVTTKR